MILLESLKLALTKLIKSPVWIKLGGILLGFMSPIALPVFAVLVFICADFGFGIWRSLYAKKNTDREPITSDKMKRTPLKIEGYVGVVLLVHLLNYVFFPLSWALASYVSCMVCLIELKSISESVAEVTGINFWVLLSKKINNMAEVPEPKDADEAQAKADQTNKKE